MLLAPIFCCSTTACSTITLLHSACSTATQAGAPPATESPSSTSRDASPPPYYSSSSCSLSSSSCCVTSMRMNHLRLLLLTTSSLFCSISCVLTVCQFSMSHHGGFAEETIGGFLTHSTLTAQGNFLLLHKTQNISFQCYPFQLQLLLAFKGFELRKQEKESYYWRVHFCPGCASAAVYLRTCRCICLRAQVFVHMQKYLSTCRCIL